MAFSIRKAANPLKIKPRKAAVKYSKLKKKAQTLAVTKVIKFTKKLSDKKSYTLVSVKKGSKSFKQYFKINKTTGKVTIKKNKKMKKGTYKVRAECTIHLYQSLRRKRNEGSEICRELG